jgi:hypothetical protein
MADPIAVDETVANVRRQVRLAALLWAAGVAGLTPLPVQRLHTLAYLSDVLAPVWDIEPLDGKLLKQAGGPFYPLLQADLDGLVGTGLVRISNLGYTNTGNDRWRLRGSYELRGEAAQPFVDALTSTASGRHMARYLRELAYAVSALDFVDFDRAASEDATYANPIVSNGGVIDFAEWAEANYSVAAAKALGNLLPGADQGSAGEELHLYVQHLAARLTGIGL